MCLNSKHRFYSVIIGLVLTTRFDRCIHVYSDRLQENAALKRTLNETSSSQTISSYQNLELILLKLMRDITWCYCSSSFPPRKASNPTYVQEPRHHIRDGPKQFPRTFNVYKAISKNNFQTSSFSRHLFPFTKHCDFT